MKIDFNISQRPSILAASEAISTTISSCRMKLPADIPANTYVVDRNHTAYGSYAPSGLTGLGRVMPIIHPYIDNRIGIRGIDLGSGKGHAVFFLSLFGIKMDGVEADAELVDIAKTARLKLIDDYKGTPLGINFANTEFHQKDLFKWPLNPYKLVYIYNPIFRNWEDHNFNKLIKKFDKELSKGSIVIANLCWPDMKPWEKRRILADDQTLYEHNITVYRR
ncbi:MAG: class I SAM-dependent methyltransferase [bacterium]